ncbi:DUF192 domain-containing protein [Methanolobus bombayensis]|uniref:DUF192 domain-containing protein n=1 Tax=Methanolobus bombayensis TaxID=38023 RepID=UPI001AE45F2E|nr:DUF192 domain-containing protein [Methanolobus bombayensis]MBP1907903.1 uncharacterized membrane protein (UPF0127 family) [Methanolobus bombayensis]
MILKSNGKEVATDVDFACSMIKQVRGLMFSRRIPDNYALVFVMKKSQRVSLHMLFVNYPIDVIFLDDEKKVIKVSSMKAWIGTCSCSKKVKYIIETSHGKSEKLRIEKGDIFDFENRCQGR